MSLTLEKVLETINQSLDTGQMDQATSLLSLAQQRWGRTVEILSLQVKLCLLSGQAAEALKTVNLLAEQQADHPLVLLQQGILQVQLGQFEAAIPNLERGIEAYPDQLNLYKWLGHAYHELGDLEQAIPAYEKAVVDLPMAKEIRLPLAFAYRNDKHLDKSDILLQEELAVNPDNLVAQFTLAQNQLMQGNLAEGFVGYESRWKQRLEDKAKIPCPLWEYGQDITGKDILIFDEQGFGDCIQFSRFIHDVVEKAKSVTVRLRPKLHHLLASQLTGCQVCGDFEEVYKADLAIPMMSLPLLLGLDRDRISETYAGQYLSADASLKINWASHIAEITPQAMSTRKKIGLIWQGDPNSPAEQGRSMSFKDVLPISDTDQAVFYILQMDDGRDRLEGQSLPDNVIDLGAELDQNGHAFVDTAAVMSLMDVVLTSDTATAHLAGALGCDSWIMLKYVPEWRWQLEGQDCYWYQSAKLFRQSSRGDWVSVTDQIVAEIRKL